jgi:hypothetical protein
MSKQCLNFHICACSFIPSRNFHRWNANNYYCTAIFPLQMTINRNSYRLQSGTSCDMLMASLFSTIKNIFSFNGNSEEECVCVCVCVGMKRKNRYEYVEEQQRALPYHTALKASRPINDPTCFHKA